MADFDVVFDPMLDKERAEFITGGTGGGSSYVGGNGITLAGGTITATVAAVDGGRLTLSGGTATFNPVANIVSASGATVTLNPDTAYKVFATTQAVTLNANVPASGKWGLEGHIELFVAGTGYVVTGSNVVLANALEPDAVNNCTVRFHDGYAIISVEDHVAGYIVTVNAASGAGSLAYGLSTATNEYISIDASLNGQTLDLAGATTYASEKHVVGNGYEETVISGGITCTSKTTFSNLSMDGVVVSSGNMTFGDVFISNGATVTMSGGSFIAEKVSGDGGTIDLNGANKTFAWAEAGSMYGIVLTNGVAANGGAMLVNAYNNVLLSGCTITGCSAGTYGGAIFAGNSSTLTMSDCLVSGNLSGETASTMYAQGGAAVRIVGGEYFDNFIINTSTASFTIDGHAKLHGVIVGIGTGAGGAVTIASGAIVDLTGNTNATPIAPNGGITFAPGGATVLYSSGAVSGSYMMDNVTLPAGAKLTNTNVIDLGQTENSMNLTSGQVGSMSNVTVTGYNSDDAGHITGAVFITGNGEWHLSNCIGTGNKATGGGAFMGLWGLNQDAHAYMTDCVVSGNTFGIYGYASIQLYRAATVELNGCTISEPIGLQHSGTTAPKAVFSGYNKLESPSGKVMGVAGSGTVTITSGATVDLTGNANATPINPEGGVIVDGGCQVITSAGSTVSIAGGTYTQINNDGTTE